MRYTPILLLLATCTVTAQQLTATTSHDTGRGVATCVRFAPGGEMAATTGHDGKVRLWDTAEWKLLERPAIESPAGQHWSLAFSPDGRRLACGSDFQVRLWSIKRGKKKWAHRDIPIPGAFGPKSGSVHAVAFTPDGKHLVGCLSGIQSSEAACLHFWNVKTGKLRKPSVTGHETQPGGGSPAVVEFVAFAKKKALMATGGFTKGLRTWKSNRRRTSWKLLKLHPDETKNGRGVAHTMCAEFSPDDGILAVGSTNGRIHVYGGPKLDLMKEFKAHRSMHVRELTFTKDGRHLVSCGENVRVWSTKDWSQVAEHALGAESKDVFAMSLDLSPDGKQVAVVDSAGTLRLFALDLP